MKRWLPAIVAILQIGVLAFMAGEREWVVRTGRVIHVRTAPIDPNDPMRGDYLRLNHEIDHVPLALCRDGVVKWFSKGTVYDRSVRDRVVYASLRENEAGVAEIESLSDHRPGSGLFVEGRANYVDGKQVHVRYGVEAMFMQQGKARELEVEMRKEMAGVRMQSEIAVGAGGLAVLKGHRFEHLGMRVVIERPTVSADAVRENRPGITGARIIFKNHGTQPLAIVDRAGGRLLQLVASDATQSGDYRWVNADREISPAVPEDVVVLKPGETRETHIDFRDSEWFVVDVREKAKSTVPVSLEILTREWGARFRFEYVAPSSAESTRLRPAAPIEPGIYETQTFSPAGGGGD